MKAKRRALSVLLVAAMVLGTPAPGLWATSAVPEPGAVGIPIDPNASGTKVAGPLSVAYEFQVVLPAVCQSGLLVTNLFVVLRLKKGVDERTFNRDFSRTVPETAPICFDNNNAQVAFVFDLASDEVMPFFFGSPIRNCFETAGISPCWAVKSVTSFLSSGTGAVSMDVDVAVKLK